METITAKGNDQPDSWLNCRSWGDITSTKFPELHSVTITITSNN